MEQDLKSAQLHRWNEAEAPTGKTISASAEITKLKLELMALRKQVQEIESQQARTETRHAETMDYCKKMVEKTLLLARGSEEKLKATTHSLLSDLANVKGKLREHKLSETKVEEMMDRHNRVVQMFEHRMDQMQKFVKEQEMKLATYRSLLNDFQAKMNFNSPRKP